MPKCEICGEWFIGYGNVCMHCTIRKSVEEYVNEKRNGR